MTELDRISSEIADYIANYYAQRTTDILTPHALTHRIAANYPGLGAAFYRLVEEAAKGAQASAAHKRSIAQ